MRGDEAQTLEPREHYGTMLPDLESLHPTRGAASGTVVWASLGRCRSHSAEPADHPEGLCASTLDLFWIRRTSSSS